MPLFEEARKLAGDSDRFVEVHGGYMTFHFEKQEAHSKFLNFVRKRGSGNFQALMTTALKIELDFEGDKLSVRGLPSHLQLRKIKYPSKPAAELKHLTVASANITAAKFYMDSIKTATKETDPHMYDAAL